jgi:hypothetical protein
MVKNLWDAVDVNKKRFKERRVRQKDQSIGRRRRQFDPSWYFTPLWPEMGWYGDCPWEMEIKEITLVIIHKKDKSSKHRPPWDLPLHNIIKAPTSRQQYKPAAMRIQNNKQPV